MNSRGNIIYVLVIIILILAIVVFYQGCNLGFGNGSGEGGRENTQISMVKDELIIDWDGKNIEKVKSLILNQMNANIKRLIIKTNPSNLRRPDKEEIEKLVKEKYNSYVKFESIKE